MYVWEGGLKGYISRCNSDVLSYEYVYVRVQSSLCLFSLGPVSCMRTKAPYLLGYFEPLYFSGPTPAQLRLRFGTPTGPKYCATALF